MYILGSDEMFPEKNMKVKATTKEGPTYTGIVYKIVIQPCRDDNDRPHTLIFISEEKPKCEYGCIALWVDKLEKIELQ